MTLPQKLGWAEVVECTDYDGRRAWCRSLSYDDYLL